MIIMVRLLFLSLFLLVVSDSADAQVFKVRDAKRAIKIIGRVDGSIIDTAEKVNALSLQSTKPIYMLINSPGGSVYSGMVLVDAIRAAKKRGVKFYCASQVMAASMAFIFLNECQYRYAAPNARLLFHPISLSTQGSVAQELIIDLDHTIIEERAIMKNLQRSMGLDWRTFHRNYFAETFWQAARLADVTKSNRYLRIVTAIEGFGKDLYKYKKPQPFFILKANGKKTSGNGTVDKILERFERGN